MEIDLFNLKCEIRDLVANVKKHETRDEIYLKIFHYLEIVVLKTRDEKAIKLIKKYIENISNFSNTFSNKIEIMGKVMKIKDNRLNSIYEFIYEIIYIYEDL